MSWFHSSLWCVCYKPNLVSWAYLSNNWKMKRIAKVKLWKSLLYQHTAESILLNVIKIMCLWELKGSTYFWGHTMWLNFSSLNTPYYKFNWLLFQNKKLDFYRAIIINPTTFPSWIKIIYLNKKRSCHLIYKLYTNLLLYINLLYDPNI